MLGRGADLWSERQRLHGRQASGWLELKLDGERSGSMGLSVDLAASRLTLSRLNRLLLNVPGRLKAVLTYKERFMDLEASSSRPARFDVGLFDEDGRP